MNIRGDIMAINYNDFVAAKVHASVAPGEALKILRELQNLSQNELAKKSGISQPNISALENGSKQMGRNTALLLAKALHVHPAVILFPDYDISKAA
jgi:transcriptional regulator with XRE-family HTH domain